MVVPTDQPKVFRVQNPDRVDTNNVYMAFLYIGELHKKERIALSVLQYFLREWIYKELREKRNLGYVASAFVDSFYFNFGIMLLLNGERFQPHEVEQTVFETLKAFVEDLKNTDPKILIDNAMSQWSEKIKIKGLLKHVSHKIYHYWEEDDLMGDKKEFKEELKNYDTKLTIAMAEKYLL